MLIETANDGVIVIQDGMIKFVNPIVIKITGYSAEELFSRKFHEFIYEEDRKMVYSNYERRMKGEIFESRYSFRILTKDSEMKWVDFSSAKMEWEGKPSVLAFLTDITERRNAEKKLMEAEQKNSALAMAVTANHEINQPLMIISGNLEFLELYCGKDEKNEKYIKRIKESISRIDNILKKMRDIEQTENLEFQQYAGGRSMINIGESKPVEDE